jgi:hypothetical protein
VFWKLIELVVRIFFFRRFRTAKKIGEAATFLSNGNPEAALTHLEKYGGAVHQTLLPLYAFTLGNVQEALGKESDAEASYKTVVLTNPKDARADFALALLTGRQHRLADCRTWLLRAVEKETADATARAKELLAHLDAIEDGSKAAEYEARARALAARPLHNDRHPGLPADTDLLSEWVRLEEAKDTIDDVALLLAYGEVQKGGQWKIGLSIEDVAVVRADDSLFRPFDLVARWLLEK